MECFYPEARQAPLLLELGVRCRNETLTDAKPTHKPTGGARKSFPPLIGPPKGINKEYKGFFIIFSLTCRDLKLRFLAFPGGPGGFRELREADRNHFHLSWYL